MVVLQIDLLQDFFILFAVFFGFLLASVAAFLKDWADQGRLRKALYNEIIAMHEALREIAENLKEDIEDNTLTLPERYRRFKSGYGYLKMFLRADAYKDAKATPALFRRVKDAALIDSVYFMFSAFENELEAQDIKMTLPEEDSLDQAVLLRTLCDEYLGYVSLLLETGTLDKKMLLKVADSAAFSKEYWEKLLQEPIPEEQQPKKVEEPTEKKNGERKGFWERIRGR
jgi:hypothetical protein